MAKPPRFSALLVRFLDQFLKITETLAKNTKEQLICFIRLHNFLPVCMAVSPCQSVSWGAFLCDNNKILALTFIRTLFAM